MIEHIHEWRPLLGEGYIRCIFPLCKAKLPIAFLSGLDRSKVNGLDGAYEEYRKIVKEVAPVSSVCVPPRTTSSDPERNDPEATGVLGGPERSEGSHFGITKICTVCNEEKNRSEFHKRARSADGRQSRCRTCNTVAVRETRRRKREMRRAHLLRLAQRREMYARKRASRKTSELDRSEVVDQFDPQVGKIGW